MMGPADETAAPLASALVRAGWPGRGRRIALSNGPAPGSLISLLDRRAFLAALGGGLLAAPRAAEAQQAGHLYRIGWLAPAANLDNLEAFRAGLRALGYVEGTNLTIEPKSGGDTDLAVAADALMRGNPDVIVTDGNSAAAAAKRTTGSIPIVFVAGDPVAMGLIPRLSKPGGNTTGLAIIATELNVKRMERVRELFPRASRLGVLYEPRQLKNMVPPMEAGARSLGFQLLRLEAGTAEGIDAAFSAAARERVAAVTTLASALFHAEKQRLVRLAAKHRLPTIYENRAFPEAGGLISYGPDMHEVFRRAATYVDRILKGAKPGDLPVEQPTKFELVINLKTAKALGLTIPPSLLQRADQVIE
jgi:putative tryptophan/tyrosine transport system substrate-binding protein